MTRAIVIPKRSDYRRQRLVHPVGDRLTEVLDTEVCHCHLFDIWFERATVAG